MVNSQLSDFLFYFIYYLRKVVEIWSYNMMVNFLTDLPKRRKFLIRMLIKIFFKEIRKNIFSGLKSTVWENSCALFKESKPAKNKQYGSWQRVKFNTFVELSKTVTFYAICMICVFVTDCSHLAVSTHFGYKEIISRSQMDRYNKGFNFHLVNYPIEFMFHVLAKPLGPTLVPT